MSGWDYSCGFGVKWLLREASHTEGLKLATGSMWDLGLAASNLSCEVYDESQGHFASTDFCKYGMKKRSTSH